MAVRSPQTELTTHRVTNQPPLLEEFDTYSSDPFLCAAIDTGPARDHAPILQAFGRRVGSAEAQEWARQANRNAPELRTFDRFGQRIDEVEFHPAYHSLMAMGLEAGVSALAWTAPRGGHSAHIAMMYLLGHADSGVCCPFSMTYASVPALRHSPGLAATWVPRVSAARYDARSVPASEKQGVTIGMAMTEKQGGSDVRANSTLARHVADDEYALTGHKWFCSAPMSDAFLTLAQTDAGLTCFLVPRWREDGSRNALQLLRLKDKLGDRSNASGEIEYHGAAAWRVGEEGRGVRTIIEMVQGTRLDCMAGSAGIMRAALAQALWHCRHRSAFGRPLIAQPAMQQVMADLCVESAASTALLFAVSSAFDSSDSADAAFARLATPISKYWICKRTPGFVYEAMECLGGAGYVEESPLPRLFRQSPLNSIWEGSGNVIALDVLRALAREPESADALGKFLGSGVGVHPGLDREIAVLNTELEADEAGARRLVERLALALQAVALSRLAAPDVTETFCVSRFSERGHLTYGAGLPVGNAVDILERSLAL